MNSNWTAASKGHASISAMLGGLWATCHQDTGTVCGRLTYLAMNIFADSFLTEAGMPDAYDVRALMKGALADDVTSFSQKQIIEVILEQLQLYLDVLDNIDAKTEKDFMAGHSLAIQMLKDAEAKKDAADSMELDGTYRVGMPQDNVALPAILALIARPEIAEGFAAVITAAINPAVFDAGYITEFEALTYERMMVPDLRRDPETGLLPGETNPLAPAHLEPAKSVKKPPLKNFSKTSSKAARAVAMA